MNNQVVIPQGQELVQKMVTNFIPHSQPAIGQPGMIPLNQIKNGYVGPEGHNGGLFAPNMQYNNIINQIPIHQSIMMPK